MEKIAVFFSLEKKSNFVQAVLFAGTLLVFPVFFHVASLIFRVLVVFIKKTEENDEEK